MSIKTDNKAFLFQLLLIFVALCITQQTTAANNRNQADSYLDCGTLENSYGPFDYTKPKNRGRELYLVESAHFTEAVKRLQSGSTGADPMPDIAYTLRAFPNHHGALDAMARLHRQKGLEKLPGAKYSVTCWFERARRFAPNDGNVYLVHAIHLFRTGAYDAAKVKFQQAITLIPDSAETHYNFGLLYVQLADFEQAMEHAVKAYELGYPLSGLKRILRSEGYWQDANDTGPDQ